VTKPTQAESKAKREREVFAAFARAAPVLNVDPQSIASCEPPKPDIACRTLGGDHFSFELGELCVPEIAKAVSDDLKRGGGATLVWTENPARYLLAAKLSKTYESTGPVHLLCFNRGRLGTQDDRVLAEGRAYLAERNGDLGPFQSIWLFGETLTGMVVGPDQWPTLSEGSD
jgi:hypothetical protein